MALCLMADLNTDIAILTKMKLCGNQYAKQGFGFSVFAMLAMSPHKGGIALVWRTKPAHWVLKGMRILLPNSISAMLVSGMRQWLLLGTYLSPNDYPNNELDLLEDKG